MRRGEQETRDNLGKRGEKEKGRSRMKKCRRGKKRKQGTCREIGRELWKAY